MPEPWITALDVAVRRTGHVDLRRLCDSAHPDHEQWRKQVIVLAGQGLTVPPRPRELSRDQAREGPPQLPVPQQRVHRGSINAGPLHGPPGGVGCCGGNAPQVVRTPPTPPTPPSIDPPAPPLPAPLNTMVPPGQPRSGVWRGGIIQIQITRACDLACAHCSQGSNLAGKPALMTPKQFERACQSLEGYTGVVGVFGGNPTLHPKFSEICEIFRGYFPLEQRGLWSNNLNGQGKHARSTFWPAHSNLNMHESQAAYDEFVQDWPESRPYLKGLREESMHVSPWIALKDIIPDEAERIALIGKCDINQHWSGLIGVLRGDIRGYFCEIAYTQAALHQDNPNWDGTGSPMPDTGVAVEPGWWRASMLAFTQQVQVHCHNCGIPARGHRVSATSITNDFSPTHEYVARMKRPDHLVQITTKREQTHAVASTAYLPSEPGW